MSKKKILIVDDAETQILYEKMMLGNAYNTITAKNGKLGWEKATAEKPDLILLDINMPVMTGIECLENLRKGEGTKDIPVIMVTTRGEQEQVEACLRLGCNDYITKPIDKMELLNKTEKYLNGGS